MKLLKINFPFVLIIFFLISFSNHGYSREIKTTKGTEFIIAFQPNADGMGVPGYLQLFVSSELGAEGMVEIPKLGMSLPFSVERGGSKTIAIPQLMSMSETTAGRVDNYGIRVTSNNPISLYGINHKNESTDAFLGIPTHSLGNKYVVMGYLSYRMARTMVVATQDNTIVKIEGYNGFRPTTITLNRMQSYLFFLTDDSTGTRIESSAPVAVFGGVDCAQVPRGVPYCDHLVEMMTPVETWGNSFVTYPLATRLNGDLIRVLAAFDNTEVKVNGQLVTVLAKSRYYDLIAKEPLEIVTSLPTSVAQYSLGQMYDGVISDPFMMLIPPVEQLLNEYTFTTPEVGSTLHFVNVVAKTSSLADLMLDGQAVDHSLFKTIGDGRYSGAQIPVALGAHNMKASNSFGIHVYGFGNYDSYGYPGGMGTEMINPINADYRNVSVVSSLSTEGVELDVGSFTVPPKQIEEIDGHINIEWFFSSFSIGQIKNLDYEVVAKNLLPGEKRVITNSLELHYQDINGVEHKRSLGKQDLDVLASGFALNISTDKAIYGPKQSVEISTHVANAGSTQAVITLELRILDADGNLVANVDSPPSFILTAKDTIQLNPQQFFTGTTYVGDYQVQAVLKDSSGLVVAEATTLFEVVAADAVLMSAQVHTDKLSYQVKDDLGIESRFSNLSTNSMLEDVTITARVLDQNGNIYWSQSSSLAQLTPGAAEAIQFIVPLVNASVANYTVQVAAVNTDGIVLASDQINFTIRDNPLFALAGNASVEKIELQRGEQPSCTYVVNNVSTKSIHEQSVRLSLVRVDEELVIKSEEESVSLSAQAAQSFTPELPVVSQVGNYACVLEAGVAGEFTTLATALFTVKESPIKLEGDIKLGEKANLLVLVDAAPAGAYGEILYVKSLLDNAGWHYTMVDNAKDFDKALSTGNYGAYALLSERVTLTPKTRERLMSEVALGDGLFVSNGHDRRHQSLEEVLGVRVHSKQTFIAGLDVQQSTLSEPWAYTFNSAFNSLTFDLVDATLFGDYVLAPPQNKVDDKPLGVASDFSVFTLENYTSQLSLVEGRMAVGGQLNVGSLLVGDKLNPAKRGDVVIVGGDASYATGRIYNGNLRASGSVANVDNSLRATLAKGAVVVGNSMLSVEFSNEAAYLQELSTNLSTLPATANGLLQNGIYTLTGDCNSKLQVLSLKATFLKNIQSVNLSCIPKNATLVLNIWGDSVELKNINLASLSAIRDKVLFNFPDAKTIQLAMATMEGSILAPRAVITEPVGQIEGQVVAKSILKTSSTDMAIHYRIFSGDLSAAWASTTKHALAHYQYHEGKTVFAAFDVTAQAFTLSGSIGEGEQNRFANLLLAALAHVNPEQHLTRAGKQVPIMITFANLGSQSVDVKVTVTLPDGFSMRESDGLTQEVETAGWTQRVSLPLTTQGEKIIYVQLPATTSSESDVNLLLQTGISPELITQAQQLLHISLH